MMALNLNDVQEMTGEGGKKLPAGGYVAKILRVTDSPKMKCLAIDFDIAEGEYKDYFLEQTTRFQSTNWPYQGIFRRSYKDTALGFFKHFLSCIDKSNGTKFLDQAAFGLNENTLPGKLIGVVLQEEEYVANNGDIKKRLIVDQNVPVDDIRAGNFKVKPLKKLEASQVPVSDFSQASDLPEGF